MQLSLPPELARLIEHEIGTGIYQSPLEVVEHALRKLLHGHSSIPGQPKSKEELEQRLLEALDRFDRGEGIDGEEFWRGLNQRIKARRADA